MRFVVYDEYPALCSKRAKGVSHSAAPIGALSVSNFLLGLAGLIGEVASVSEAKIVTGFENSGIHHKAEVRGMTVAEYVVIVDNAHNKSDLFPLFDLRKMIRQTIEVDHKAKDERPKAPPCRISSGVCGLPLSAKIVTAIILVGPAWWLLFRALDHFDGLGGRRRSRGQAARYLASSFILFGLIVAAWGWSGSY